MCFDGDTLSTQNLNPFIVCNPGWTQCRHTAHTRLAFSREHLSYIRTKAKSGLVVLETGMIKDKTGSCSKGES